MEDIEMGEKEPLVVQRNSVPFENQIHYCGEELLKAVINNRTEDIQSICLNCTENDLSKLFQKKFVEYNGKTMLLIACDLDEVTGKTLSTLCSSIKRVECIDDNNYGWEPIHYVAKNADPKKLKILLKHLESSQIDSLTYFSENALHILLQYEKSVNTFKVELFDGIDSRPCIVLSKEKENMVKCARELIEKGIDINHANFWGETPICLAIKYKYSRIVDELLKNSYIDLDNYFFSGQTIREYLKLNNLSFAPFPQSGGIEETVTILFNFLKFGDEDAFIRHASEAKCVWVDEEDGSGTMLQFCLRKGFLDYLQDECYNKEYRKGDIRSSPMLKTFCKKGLSRSITFLLDNGADPKKTSKKFKESLLEYAALRGYYPFVALLLCNKNSNIGTPEIFEVLKKLNDKKHPCNDLKNASFYRKCVSYLLLNKLLVTFDRVNDNLTYNKLSILNETMRGIDLESTDNESLNTELVCQLLHLGASLTQEMPVSVSDPEENKDTDTGIVNQMLHIGSSTTKEKILLDLLDINTLISHLDDCVESNTFHYNSIIDDHNNIYSETKTINLLANNNMKKGLLVHPLFIYFIKKKWSRISWVFYLDLFFYFTFLSSIYVYMISSHTKLTSIYSTSIFMIMLSIHMMKEACQLFFLFHWKYFKDPSNYLELTVIVSCIVTYVIPNVYSMIVAILFSTMIFFIMLGQLPIFAKYTVIFGSAKYFFEYTGFYFIQFLSFSICFYIIFPFKPSEDADTAAQNNVTEVEKLTGDIFKSLFYTLIHFTGEFSERVLEPKEYPVFGRFITTIFIFCMTIILNNLLVGLIVADMDEIQKSGRLYKQVKIATFIQTTDTFVKRIHDWKWMDCIKGIINRVRLFKKNKPKNLYLDDDEAYYLFDEENIDYLKNLKINKQQIFDRNVLNDCYDFIRKGNSNSPKQKQELSEVSKIKK